MNLFTVRKHTLLLIASFVWLAAGVNIARIGLEAYANGHLSILNVALSVAVGAVFWMFVFGKLVVKHTARISSYADERHFFLKFFDIPAFSNGVSTKQISRAATMQSSPSTVRFFNNFIALSSSCQNTNKHSQ